ncbi:MAG: hypothetical protein SPJ04_00010 [Bdellovibrionota bacterium]|nr:hypothetical protein [Bdellovibrionota bacterium]
MKTLEQLGISPTPWDVDNNNNIRTDDGYTLAATMVSDVYGDDRTEQDALIIAAAPELYEALRMYQEAFEEIRKSAWFLDANFHEIMSLNKVMTAADAALAKAAGESEVVE